MRVVACLVVLMLGAKVAHRIGLDRGYAEARAVYL